MMEQDNREQNETCKICLEVFPAGSPSLGCGHPICRPCLGQYFENEFCEKRKSFLDVCCPADKCPARFSASLIRDIASPAALEKYEAVLATIPRHPEDPRLGLADFCYEYNERSELRHTKTGEPFHWVNQVHYDLLCDMIVPWIQQQMVTKYNLKEVRLPLDEDVPNGLPAFVRNNIFISEDALSCSRLLLIIQGSGAVRPGQWARALCINDTLQNGTIFPYLERARQHNMGVVVFNPNMNQVPAEDVRPQREHFFIPGKPQIPKSVDHFPIPGSEDPVAHTLYVWDRICRNASAKKIGIVAHSAGGHCTMALLRSRGNEVLSRLKCIAFTDSAHSVSRVDTAKTVSFLRKNAVDWIRSDKPLDAPEKEPSAGCKVVSAGHPKHEWTSGVAVDSVFAYLVAKLS